MDPRESVITEHRNYLLAASTQFCAADILEMIGDKHGLELVRRYELAYNQYFGMFCDRARARRPASVHARDVDARSARRRRAGARANHGHAPRAAAAAERAQGLTSVADALRTFQPKAADLPAPTSRPFAAVDVAREGRRAMASGSATNGPLPQPRVESPSMILHWMPVPPPNSAPPRPPPAPPPPPPPPPNISRPTPYLPPPKPPNTPPAPRSLRDGSARSPRRSPV